MSYHWAALLFHDYDSSTSGPSVQQYWDMKYPQEPTMLIPVALTLARLRELRLRAALSQDDLAQLAGVSRQTVARGEAGEAVRPSSVRKLAEALRVKPQALLR